MGVRMRALRHGHDAEPDPAQAERFYVAAVRSEAQRALCDHGGEDGSVRNGAAHGTRGVLAGRYGHHALAADHPDSGLESYEAVDRRRREDGTVGLRAD